MVIAAQTVAPQIIGRGATIPLLITYLKQFTGYDYAPCDYFTGWQRHTATINGVRVRGSYFNVETGGHMHSHQKRLALQRLANNSRIIVRAEPNGVTRMALTLADGIKLL